MTAELFSSTRFPFSMEIELMKDGHVCIAGIDEVGRGALAGPVVAAAIVLDPEKTSIAGKIRDSKKLTPKTREYLYEILQREAVAIGVGFIHHDVIDQINILQATLQAMKIAVDQLKTKPDVCLVDGNQKFPTSIRQICIPKGDDLITSIGAASIIAKVTRDRWMKEITAQYPHYLFEKNKGYGSEAHIEAIRANGFSAIHRRSFSVKLA